MRNLQSVTNIINEIYLNLSSPFSFSKNFELNFEYETFDVLKWYHFHD